MKGKKKGGGEEMTFEPLNLKSDRLLNLNWTLAPESTSTGTRPPATPSSSSSGGTASSPPVQSQRKVVIKVLNNRTWFIFLFLSKDVIIAYMHMSKSRGPNTETQVFNE